MAVFDFKKTEERIREFWRSQRIFQKSLQAREGAERFVFFEGPPTANGRPGVHHILARAFKDLYGRYKTMRGFFVLRKAGWDTHGLPVELEVEKTLGFKNKKDIEQYGVAAFNKKAKESVWKYKKEWEEMTERMAYWLDMDHPYVTYETPYVESLWTVIKKIWDKGLLYQAHRVVPFCTRCGTPLSSHEVAQGYKKVTENSVYLKFKLKSESAKTYNLEPGTSILAWTTTPWTLPGNVALAVGEKIVYAIFSDKRQATSDKEFYIAAKERLDMLVGEGNYEIIQELSGHDLVGLEYEPLFDVPQLKNEKSYRVYAADFVSTQDGTGVVHTAVMYGEDDYKLGTELGLPKVHTVDEQGKFMNVSAELDGKYVKSKETESLIIEHLQQNGTLFKQEEYEHDYPHCWRCDTPLLYYAKTSWFIKMSAVNKKLLENNETINWIPAHLKEGRFGQWLKEGKDWAFSRERYWGTPLPVWQCQECKSYRVIGALAELEEHRYRQPNNFFLVRHGVTDRGSADRKLIINSYTGEYDIYDLNEAGKAQVQAIAQELKNKNIDLIVASPFKRAQGTAQILSEVLGLPFATDERLGEIQHGLECEGKTHAICLPDEIEMKMDTKRGTGESWNDVKARMMAVATELDRQHEGKNIVIISHGDPLWMLTTGMLGWDDEATLTRRPEIYVSQGSYRVEQLKNYPYNDEGNIDLHRPYVDEIILKCDQCSGAMRKLPDLVDVWFDSGAMPYAQWHWPFENDDVFRQQFPADFIVEAVDQTRGWFYTLLAVATLLDMGAPYRNVMSLGHILDAQGKKMSKSRGNVVIPGDLMDAVGVDASRWYLYTVNQPGDPTLFDMKDVQEKLKGFLATLENCVRFYELYEKTAPRGDMELTLLDQWMLSRLNRVILDVTARLDEYDPTSAARMIESLVVDDLSKWWLRRSRNRPEAIGMLKYLLFVVAKLMAPFAPYTAEDIYQRIGGQEYGAASVHLQQWPQGDSKMVNDELEAKMKAVQETITAGLAIRKDKQLKVRQPLSNLTTSWTAGIKIEEEDLKNLVKDEVNVEEVKTKMSGDVELDLVISPELQAKGYARELIRQIQDMRKEAGYGFQERALVHWQSDDNELADAINHWEKTIEKETVLSDLVQQRDGKDYDIEKETDLAPGKKVWLGIKK